MLELSTELLTQRPVGAGKPLAISLMGPTASGKTDLAIALHQRYGAEIISVDSALVYRGMDIGSAKPSAQELSLAPHRLIDIRDPSEPYSAADFARDAKREIQKIIEAGKIPLLVGGTMLYFKALLEGLSDLPEADPKIRKEIETEAGLYGWEAIHKQLAEVDPESAAKIHPNHSQRLSRALEVYRVSGKPMSQSHGQLSGGVLEDYDWCQIAIGPRDRKVLHDRIRRRYRQMLDNGLIQEVEGLRNLRDVDNNRLLHKDLPAMRAVGYRQAWDYLDGELNYDEMVEKGVVATRQLAKRQLTWLRSWQGVHWLDTQAEGGQILSLEEIIAKLLKFFDKRDI